VTFFIIERPFTADDIRERSIARFYRVRKKRIRAKGDIEKFRVRYDIPHRSIGLVHPAGDHADIDILPGGDHQDFFTFYLLVPRIHHFTGLWKVDPELEPPHAAVDGFGHFLVDDPRARGHPLDIAGTDTAGISETVFMIDRPFKHVGDSLDSPVRVLRKTGQIFARLIRAEIIEHEKRVELRQFVVPECPVQPDTCSFDRCICTEYTLNCPHLIHREGTGSDCSLRYGWLYGTGHGARETLVQKPVNTGRQRTYPVVMGLKDQLAGMIPADLLPYVSDHFEVIGNIAILFVPHELEEYKILIADAVVSKRKNIVTVLNKTEKVAGDSRTARYEVLLGDTTVTVHQEFGFSYRIDVGSSFFSPRMASERKRVTGQVQPGEKVYVPFAGVGPFAIPAAARGAEVWAVEKNPDAFRWLKYNVALNHTRNTCHIIQGDALNIAQLRETTFDRLIIPAPYGMDYTLEILLPLLSYGGMAHVYLFKTREQIPGLITAYEDAGLDVMVNAPCGNVAPGVSRWVFDLARLR